MAIRCISIDRRVLDGFRRRAKKEYPREFMEALFGKIVGETVEVHVAMPVPHFADRESCQYDPNEIELLKEELLPTGLEFVATLHSHPGMDTCCHPSDADHDTGVQFREPVMGVMWLRKQDGKWRTTTTFNVPRKPLSVKLS